MSSYVRNGGGTVSNKDLVYSNATQGFRNSAMRGNTDLESLSNLGIVTSNSTVKRPHKEYGDTNEQTDLHLVIDSGRLKSGQLP